MSGNLKLIIGGLLAGVVLVFALIGIKNTFAPSQPVQNTTDTTPSWQQAPSIMPNANVPSIDSLPDGDALTRPLNDKPPTDDETRIELVGEPNANDADPATPPAKSTQDGEETSPTPPGIPADEVSTQPQPATPAPVASKSGKLEIVAQSETGKAIKANVYVQQANGANIDKATYTSKASFALKPGAYKITVRAEGYGSLTRTVTVADGAAVSEIFPLPAIAASAPVPAQPPRQTAPVPVAQAPAPAGDGRLRIVALSADDGSPLPVDFTITRPDGSVIDRINDVPMTELTLPAQQLVVSFNFRGLQGSQTLNVRTGQTTTHTFNIRGVHGNRADNPQPPMPQQAPPDMGQMQQPQQPQNIEEMLMQRLQQELQKHLNN